MNQGGVLSICKPEGMSSAKVVAVVKRGFGFKKVGHFGTLDPFAKGLMLIGVEQGTKLSSLIMSLPKRYWASVKLGERTDTLDPTGRVVASSLPPWPSLEAVEIEAKRWVGRIEQKVPRYSAVKIKGVRLYNATRQGIDIEPPIKSVVIHSINILSVSNNFFEIDVFCSKGTYLRALAADMATGMGHEGMLNQLCRLEIGKFTLNNALTIEQLEAMSWDDIVKGASWSSLTDALDEIPKIRLSERMVDRVLNGQLPMVPPMESDYVRLVSQKDDLVGLLKKGREGWEIERVFPI